MNIVFDNFLLTEVTYLKFNLLSKYTSRNLYSLFTYSIGLKYIILVLDVLILS